MVRRTLEMNVREASEKGTTLVCISQNQIEVLKAEATRQGVTIQEPMLIGEYQLLKSAMTLD